MFTSTNILQGILLREFSTASERLDAAWRANVWLKAEHLKAQNFAFRNVENTPAWNKYNELSFAVKNFSIFLEGMNSMITGDLK